MTEQVPFSEQNTRDEQRFQNPDYLQKFFPPFIKKLAELKERNPHAEKMYDRLVRYLLDPGLNRDTRFGLTLDKRPPGSPESVNAPRVAMLNRNGIVTVVEQLLADGVIQDKDSIEFQLRDIEKFRDADEKDQNIPAGNSADVIINQAAEELLKMQGEFDVNGRYGGDELVTVSWDPDVARARTKAEATDIALTQGSYGYYKKPDGSFEYRALRLKPGIKSVRAPKDPELNKIFWEQFSKGLILNETELIDIQKQQANNSFTELDLSGKKLMEERIAHIKKNHPEYSEFFNDLPGMVDPTLGEVERLQELSKLQTELVEYIESTVYDRLLGDLVTTFYDFQEDVNGKDLVSAFCFDLKFIKEINDYKSIANGDLAIKSLFAQIINNVPEEDRQYVKYYRRGSTILVGIRSGAPAQLQEDTYQNLYKIRSISLGEEEIPIGKVTFVGLNADLPIDVQEKTGATMGGVVLDKLLTESESNWFEDIVELAKDDLSYLDEPTIAPDEATEVAEDVIQKGMLRNLKKKELIQLFFNGKRAIERTTKAIDSAFRKMSSMVFDPAQQTKYSQEYSKFDAVYSRLRDIKTKKLIAATAI